MLSRHVLDMLHAGKKRTTVAKLWKFPPAWSFFSSSASSSGACVSYSARTTASRQANDVRRARYVGITHNSNKSLCTALMHRAARKEKSDSPTSEARRFSKKKPHLAKLRPFRICLINFGNRFQIADIDLLLSRPLQQMAKQFSTKLIYHRCLLLAIQFENILLAVIYTHALDSFSARITSSALVVPVAFFFEISSSLMPSPPPPPPSPLSISD